MSNVIIETMSDKPNPEMSAKKKIKIWLFIGGGVVILAIVIIAIMMTPPARSVAAYCSEHKKEKSRLAALPGGDWPSGLFDDEVGDAGEIANSLGKLERVAPQEISPSLASLQKLYQKIDDDPSQAVAASLSGGDIDESLKQFTVQQCR
jgi:hypothetical protein